MSAIELTRVVAKSKDQIRDLSNHPIFKKALTDKGIERYDNENMVIKSWIILFNDTKSFETSVVRPVMRDANITSEQKEAIAKCYDYLLSVYEVCDQKDDKDSERVKKKILKKTNLLTLMPIIDDSIRKDIKPETMAECLLKFFGSARSTSIDETYNANARAGSSKAESIKRRVEALTAWIDKTLY